MSERIIQSQPRKLILQIEELENVGYKIGVKMTVDLGHRSARIRLQGQSKEVYQAESRIKEMLHKIKAELMEQQEAVMLAQFVSENLQKKPSYLRFKFTNRILINNK